VNANLFALLDDDNEDDSGAPVQKQAPANKPAAKAEKKEEQAPQKKPEQRERKGKGEGRARGGKDRRDNNQEDGTPYDGSDKPQKPTDGERKGGKGRRRNDDGEGKGKGKGKGRRDYDRHSGSNRGKGENEPRGGRGKYNWGDKTEATAPMEAGEPAEGIEDAAEGEKKPKDEVPAEPIEEEEEENTMTFEEYMKKQENENQVGKKLVERKVTESEMGGKLYTVATAYNRDSDKGGSEDNMYGMAFHDYDGKHKDHEEKEAREGWVQADKFLQIKFVDPNAGGKGDRDDRRSGKGKGGGKGGKGDRAGGRGSRNNSRPQQSGGKALELDDSNAFPSLA
jgi:plasminogen activator inhibitor 1 RNA-binding protein